MRIRFLSLPVVLFMGAMFATAQTSNQTGQQGQPGESGPQGQYGQGQYGQSQYGTTQPCTPDMQSAGLCIMQTPNRGTTLQPYQPQGTNSGYINPLNSNTPFSPNLYGSQSQTTSGANQQNQYSSQSLSSRYGNQNQSGMIPLPPEPLTDFQRFVTSTTKEVLPIFGASLFRQVPSTFAPLDQGPVPSNYVLGVGDQIRVQVWGQVNFSTETTIDRTGGIYLPQVGEVHLAGTSVSSLPSVLRDAVSHVFKNFHLTASVGRIRSIQVYVVGQARRPGVYTISSLSTLVDALFASGGPSPDGSMRNIEVRRDGKVVAHFDLYRLLLSGDRSNDLSLLSGDVIFIPPVGPQAAVAGSVNHPAIYELRKGETIGQLIQDAGGSSTIAAKTYISIDRIVGHQSREAMQVSFNEAGLSTAAREGDVIRIHSIVPLFKNTVTLLSLIHI